MIVIDQITAALISLVVGTVLGSELTRFLYRPRVIIRYKDTSPLYAPDGVHWTIKVANIGRTVASNCKGIIYVDGINQDDLLGTDSANPQELLPDYKEENTDLSFPRHQQIDGSRFRPISGAQIAWACLGNPQSMDINPGITELLDICKIQFHDKGDYIIFPTEYGWRRLRARVKVKNISGKIMICPSNEFPTVIHFRLEFDDKNQSVFIPIKPSFLQRVKKTFFRQKYYFG